MGEFLTSYTSLPNLHPALVHFPIALLPIAVFFDILGLLNRTQRVWLDRAATSLYALAGLSTAAAFWAGRRAADSLVGLSPREQILVGEHHDAALFAFWLVGIFAIVRVAIGVGSEPSKGLPLRAVFLPVALAALVLVLIAADRGGGLVFRHGLAVAQGEDRLEAAAVEIEPRSPVASGAGAAGGVESRLESSEDGTSIWEPLAEDGQALSLVLRPADGSSSIPVEWEEPVGPGESGLGLRVSGRSMLVLPGEFGDVQVEAELEIGEFDGTVGLAHHVRSTRDAGVFLVSTTSGEAHLAAYVEGAEVVMAKGEVTLDSSVLRLAVFAAGRHFRGLQNGEVVVHGHRPPLAEGGWGLVLDGRGVVRIRSMKIISIVE